MITMAVLLYNVKFILLLSASFIIIFSGIAIYFCLPLMISQLLRNQLVIAPGSGSFEGWRSSPVPIIDRFYLYNITNYDEVIQTIQTPNNSENKRYKRIKLSQMGPFSYRQEREKVNISFDGANNTVIYDQLKRWHFLPDLTLNFTTTAGNSVHDNYENNLSSMSLLIYHMNLPLAGTTLNTDFADAINPFVNEHELELFLKHNVSQLLFDGYLDELMQLAKESNSLDIDKFGWMYNQNNVSSGTMRIFTGEYPTFEKMGLIQQINYDDELNVWSKEGTCNHFSHASAGDLFPPSKNSFISAGYRYKLPVSYEKQSLFNSQKLDNSTATSSDEKSESSAELKRIYIFLPDICRSFELVFNGSHYFSGLRVNRFIANEYTFDYTTDVEITEQSSKKCYCLTNELSKVTACPPNGMMDLYTCRKGSPLTISFPHFLYSDQDKTLKPYLDIIEDEIKPNFNDHGFFMDLEPTLNIPVRVQVALQFNIHYKPEVSLLNFTQNYKSLFPPKNDNESGDYYIPQMWFSSRVQVDDDTLVRLKFMQRYMVLITPITAIILFLTAFALLLTTVTFAYRYTYGEKSKNVDGCRSTSLTSLSYPISDSHDRQKYQQLQMESGIKMNVSSKCSKGKKRFKKSIRLNF